MRLSPRWMPALLLAGLLSGCHSDREAACCPGHAGRDEGLPAGSVVAPAPEWVEYALTVTVQSTAGYALPGAGLQLVVGDGRPGIQGQTDEQGRAVFVFTARPGTWLFVDACATGFYCAALDFRTCVAPEILLPVELPVL